MYCSNRDTAEHTIFVCNRWSEYRRAAFEELGPLTPDTITSLIVESEKDWKMVHDMIKRIMRDKEKEEYD